VAPLFERLKSVVNKLEAFLKKLDTISPGPSPTGRPGGGYGMAPSRGSFLAQENERQMLALRKAAGAAGSRARRPRPAQLGVRSGTAPPGPGDRGVRGSPASRPACARRRHPPVQRPAGASVAAFLQMLGAARPGEGMRLLVARGGQQGI